jgi:hypothetical protein
MASGGVVSNYVVLGGYIHPIVDYKCFDRILEGCV